MKYLTTDFGSTYTKVTAIDADKGGVVGTAAAFTTIETDVMKGFRNALQQLEQHIGTFDYDEWLFCSSAAGGLKMVALGLVPELTAKAARTAAASAGAKVVKSYSFEITKAEQREIFDIDPDIVLLCGGTDGGNKEVITANAKRLGSIARNFSIIAAGNKSASDELEAILSASGKNFVITDNVMPEFNKLNIEPARKRITELFISHIIEAKGLSAVQAMTPHEIIPTPLAVMRGCELLSKGTRVTEGIGDLTAIDIGGATTDVYSLSEGRPSIDNVLVKGIPEPYAKRSVEGDLGMRYSLTSLAEAAEIESIALETGLSVGQITRWVETCHRNPALLAAPGSREQVMEEALARSAVRIAMERHCGHYASAYTPVGEMFTLVGKDLSEVPYVIGIGGVVINSPNYRYILEGAVANPADFTHAKPKHPTCLLDKRYIFASMGLLCSADKELALQILKKEITS